MNAMATIATNAFMKTVSNGLWDYAYAMTFVGVTFNFPEIESGSIPITSIRPIMFFLGVIPLVPIAGAVTVRLFFFHYIRTASSEKDARYWNLFFFGTVRVLNVDSSLISLQRFENCFGSRSCSVCNVGRREKSIRPDKRRRFPFSIWTKHQQIECIHHETIDDLNNDILVSGMSTIVQAQQAPKNSPPMNTDTNTDYLSDEEEEVELFEPDIAWSCVTCNEFNLMKRVMKNEKPNSKLLRFGTRENSEQIRIVVHTVGDIQSQYAVEMKNVGRYNLCYKCGTPANYKPRKCAERFFHPQRDYSRIARAKEQKRMILSSSSENDSIKTSLLEQDETINEKAMRAKDDTIISNDDNCAGYIYLICHTLSQFAKGFYNQSYKRYMDFKERNDPPIEEIYIYNDHTKKEKLDKFVPKIRRKLLKEGCHYEVTDTIESIADRNDWYSASILRIRRNDHYDIVYHDGAVSECVPSVDIRFCQTYCQSSMMKLITAEIVAATMICPLLFAYSMEKDEASILKSIERGVTHPMLIISSITVAASFALQVRSYLRTVRSGILLHFKLFIALSFSSWMLLLSNLLIDLRINNEQRTIFTTLHWWHSLIPSVLFSIAVITHMTHIEFVWGVMAISLTVPLVLFQVLYLLSMDGAIKISAYTKYAPLQVFAVMIICLRSIVPLVRSSDF